MKYFAILKDSFREALDSKVLYVLLALSTLAIGFVATISCKPLSAEKTMEQFFFTGLEVPLTIILNIHKPERMAETRMDRKKDLLPNRLQDQATLFSLKKVDLLRGEPDGPRSEYALTIAYRPFPAGVHAPADANDPSAVAKAIRELFREAEEFGYLRVGDVELIEKAKVEGQTSLYRATVQGTPRMACIWATDCTLLGVIPLRAPFPSSYALGFELYFLASLVLFFGELTALLLSVIITSFFIPSMLQKGTIDLLLAKPIQRWLLLLNKYFGGLTLIFINTAYAIFGIWLVLGLRTGLWANGMFLLIFTVTFFFAILYAISTFVAVLTRSTVTAIMVTIGAWVMFFVVGTAHKAFDRQYRIEQDYEKKGKALPEAECWGNNSIGQGFRLGHAIMPRTSDLGQLDDMILYTTFMTGGIADLNKFDNSDRNWWESLTVCLVWIAIFLGLAILRFSYKDY